MDTVSTITTFKSMAYSERFKCIEISGDRTIAIHYNFEELCEAVKSNACDMCETIYDYAIVQELELGFYPKVVRQKLFQVKNITQKAEDGKEYYNPNLTYEEIELPDRFPPYGIAIG